MRKNFRAHKELLVWQVANEITREVYELTKLLPKAERFGLCSQLRRAAISVPSNIAEGYRRRQPAVNLQFAYTAFGSASELETQISLVKDLGLCDPGLITTVEQKLDHLLRLLNGYCEYLNKKSRSKPTSHSLLPTP
jgi:four helix bundle protein